MGLDAHSLAHPHTSRCWPHGPIPNDRPTGWVRVWLGFWFSCAAEYQKYKDNRSGPPVNWCHLSFSTFLLSLSFSPAEPPHNAPLITGIHSRYRVGDILRGNCTSRHSRPAANLTWTVNNEEVSKPPPTHHHPPRSTPLDGLDIMQTQFSCFQALASARNLCVCFPGGGMGGWG